MVESQNISMTNWLVFEGPDGQDWDLEEVAARTQGLPAPCMANGSRLSKHAKQYAAKDLKDGP